MHNAHALASHRRDKGVKGVIGDTIIFKYKEFTIFSREGFLKIY